jgi:hypothetical protein
MKKLIKAGIVFVAMLAPACTNEGGTTRTLHRHGFTDIQVGGYDPWSCGNDDTSSTSFVATNPAGIRVRGTVCCGLFTKSCTVRF